MVDLRDWVMDYFVKKWNNTFIRYDQENNIIELFLEKMRDLGDTNFSLESCNVESAACAVEAVGADWTVPLPEIDGIKYLGYGDMMFDFLNSPKMNKLLPFDSKVYPQNEMMENLAFAIKKFSAADARKYVYENTDIIDYHIKQKLKRESAVVLSYLTNYGTGHYITIVKWNGDKKKFICYDSWSKNVHCKNDGILEEYSAEFFIERARPRLLEVWKK